MLLALLATVLALCRGEEQYHYEFSGLPFPFTNKEKHQVAKF